MARQKGTVVLLHPPRDAASMSEDELAAQLRREADVLARAKEIGMAPPRSFSVAQLEEKKRLRAQLEADGVDLVAIEAQDVATVSVRTATELAREAIEKLAPVERPAPQTPPRLPGSETTLDAFRASLAAARTAEGKTSVGREQRIWKGRVSPILGHLPIGDVTRDQIEDFRDGLDALVRERIAKGKGHGLSGKTALIIWTLVRSTFKEAVNARDRKLRVRTDDPTAGVKPPLRSPKAKKTFLYPIEFDALMACERVPLEWRETYAVAAYLYLRPGELRALTFGDVDLGAGLVHVTKAYDEEARDVKPPKTVNGIRDVPIEPSLAPLLTRLSNGKRSTDLVAPLLGTIGENKRALLFREHLEIARLTRKRLTKSTATELMVNLRSLRDSGITWLAIAGVELARIQRRAGHDDIKTTLGYVKMAEDLTGAIGTPFSPLPFAPAAESRAAGRRDRDAGAPKRAAGSPKTSKLRLLDSNPLDTNSPVLQGLSDALERATDERTIRELARAIRTLVKGGA